MSLKELISTHLDDYIPLISRFLDSIADGETQQAQRILTRLIRKDELLQECINKLPIIQHFEEKLNEVREEIAILDKKIISFASDLGDLEQSLHDVVTEPKTLKSLDRIITQQTFTVKEVLMFAERLGVMSAAPADFIEGFGLAASHPPAPQEDLMGLSRLRYGASTTPTTIDETPAQKAAAQSPIEEELESIPVLPEAENDHIAPVDWKPEKAPAYLLSSSFSVTSGPISLSLNNDDDDSDSSYDESDYDS